MLWLETVKILKGKVLAIVYEYQYINGLYSI